MTTLRNLTKKIYTKSIKQVTYLTLLLMSCILTRVSYAQAPVPESFFPDNEATGASIASSNLIQIIFTEEVVLTSGTIEIRKYSNDQVAVSVNEFSPNLELRQNSGENKEVVIHSYFDLVLEYNTQYYVTITNGFVQSPGGDFYPGISNKDTWKFTTMSPNALSTYIHKTPGALIDPATTFEYKIAVNQLLQEGSTGTLRLVNLTDEGTIVSSYGPGNGNVSISNNVVTISFTETTSDLNQYAVRWDEGYFENTSGGLIEENNSSFYFYVYKAQPPVFNSGQESFWPHDLWGPWEQDGDYLSVTFDRPAKKGTGKISIYNYNTDQLVEEIDVVADAEKVITKEEHLVTSVDIFPSTIFSSGTRYYVTWDGGVFVDLSNAAHPVAALTDKEFWSFTLDGELPLEIVSLTPTNEAIVEDENPDLIMTFSKNVVAGTSANSDFIVIRDIYGSSVEYFFVTDERVTGLGTHQLTLSPNSDLVTGMKYYIEFAANIVKGDDDIHFEGWTGDSNWSFQIGELNPYITLFSPDRFQTGVSVDLEKIEFTYDRNVKINDDFASLGISLRRSGYGAAPELDINKNSEELEIIDNKLIIHLPRPLLYNQQYAIFFQNNFILDMDDKPFTGFSDSFYQFTTETTTDVSGPSLVSISPANGATDVPASGFEFELTFNESVFKEFGFARIKRYDDDVLIRNVSLYVYSDEFQVDGDKLILKPNVTLQEGVEYYLEIATGAMIDQNRNGFIGIDKEDYSFTTSPPLPPIELISTFPAHEATDASWGPGLELEFNQPITYTGGNGKIKLKNYADNETVFSYQASQVSTSGNWVELSSSPDFFLSHGTKYFLEIDAGAFVDENDGPYDGLSDKELYNFSASWDMPAVAMREPAYNATNVDRNQTITITFDRPITLQNDEGVSGDAQFHFRLRQTPIGSGTAVDTDYMIGDGAISYSGNTLTINPVELLDYAMEVNILIVNNVVMGVEEENGEFDWTGPLQGANSISFYLFTTEKEPQTITFNKPDDVDINSLSGNVMLEASASSGHVVSFEVISGPATLVNGNELEISGTGTVEVKAFHPGNDHYVYAESIQIFGVFDSSKEDQAITFESITDKTVGDDDFELNAGASSGLPITFTVTAGQPLVSLEGSSVSILSAGNVTIRAEQAGDEVYNAATPVSRTFTIHKIDQTISFTAIADKTFGEEPFEISATATSGLGVTYSVVSGPVNVDGSVVTITGAGEAVIAANQSGNGTFNPAAQVTASFTIAKAYQAIVFEALEDKVYGDTPVNLVATSSVGLTVAFSVVSGPATVSGSQLSITGAGEVVVAANQAGNANYNMAAQVAQSFTVAKADQIISLEAIEDQPITSEPFMVVVTVGSGLPLIYEVSGPAAVSDGVITLDGTVGTVTITVTQAGNENYNPATASATFLVYDQSKANQTITFEAIEDKTYGDGPFSLSASASSGLDVVYSVESGPVSVSGNTVTITGAGSAVIIASQPGDDAFNPAAQVKQAFSIGKSQAAIMLAELEQVADGSPKQPVVSTEPEGLEYSITFDGNDVLPSESGSYEVVVTIEDLNYEGTMAAIFILSEESVLGLVEKESLHVYPNPVDEAFEVISFRDSSIRLFDMHGRLCLESRTNQITPVNHLSAGIYLIVTGDTQLRLIKR